MSAKVSTKPPLTAPAIDDVCYIIDSSEASSAAKSKKISFLNLSKLVISTTRPVLTETLDAVWWFNSTTKKIIMVIRDSSTYTEINLN